jgi:DNA-damage-inducible protein J
MAQVNLTVRIDEDIKKEAESLFAKIGLTMSSAINVFFRQAVREQAIPFEIKSYPSFYITPESIAALEESKRLMKAPNVKTFKSTQALVDDLLNGDGDD